MSKSIQDIESFIREMDLTCEIPREGTCVVTGLSDVNNVVITLAGPVVVFRVKIMEVPLHHREDLYRTLLELNATEMMHGAYGIEGASHQAALAAGGDTIAIFANGVDRPYPVGHRDLLDRNVIDNTERGLKLTLPDVSRAADAESRRRAGAGAIPDPADDRCAHVGQVDQHHHVQRAVFDGFVRERLDGAHARRSIETLACVRDAAQLDRLGVAAEPMERGDLQRAPQHGRGLRGITCHPIHVAARRDFRPRSVFVAPRRLVVLRGIRNVPDRQLGQR